MKWLIIFLTSASILFGQAETFYSVQTHFGQFYRSDMDSAGMVRMLDSIKAAGIKFIRDECYWSDVEQVRGHYDFPEQVDRFVKAASERGINILLILDFNNALYAPHSGAGIVTDSNRAAYTKYCVETVKRYSAMGVKYYEIWNEPNIPQFWDPIPNAEDYFKMLQSVYPALKALNIPTVILGCATSPAEGNPAPFISGLDFIRQVYELGGGNYMDGVSFHLYTVNMPVETWYPAAVNGIKTIVKEKPLYITETGYPTSSVWPNVSQQTQAYYLSRFYLLGRRDLQMINWYDLKNDGEDPAENEHNFGIMNYNLTPKPAYVAYKNTVEQTSGKELDSVIISNTNYHYIFRNGTEETHAVWNSAQNSIISDQFPKGALQIVYALGRKEYFFDKDGIVTLPSLPEPAFITGINSLPEIDRIEFIEGLDSVLQGQRVKYEIRGYTKKQERVSIDFSAALWSFSNENASFDSLGYLTANAPGKGFITAGFGGREVKREIEILPYSNLMGIESFNSLDSYKVTTIGMLPSASVSVTDTNASDGTSSVLINYDLKYLTKTSHKIILEKYTTLPGEPDSLLIDVYNNANGHVINFEYQDAGGGPYSVSSRSDSLAGRYGWKTLRLPLSSSAHFVYPAKLKRMIIYIIPQNAKQDSIYSGKILIDNLRTHYKPLTAVDKEYSDTQNYILYQNYPNPFNPATTISYNLVQQSRVELKVFNTLGQLVKHISNVNDAGFHEVNVNLNNFSSGIYIYVLEANSIEGRESFRDVKKMILMK